ncbi:aldose 1-epimerase [Cohnella boryungensis]|uniref:Aldose 1-epimerase n=1 Tax=Cohnella boryungensis TaxID=768479 RepID=A0ABV8S5A6_9BACL
MKRYGARVKERDGFDVIELTDRLTDSLAEIAPEFGCNLYRFECRSKQVLVPPPLLSAFRDEEFDKFRYGTPILFPPNRVKDGRIAYRGKEYRLPLNEPTNHLHGELSSRPWEVIDLGESEKEGAYVTARFQYSSHPDILAYFPHPLTFTVTIRLYEGRLAMGGTIKNEGGEEAPFAFGLHPYFSLPFGNGEEIVLRVPAAEEWPVTDQAFVTGEPSKTAFSGRLRSGVPISDYPRLGCSLLSLDDSGDRTCRIELKESGYTIAYRLGPEFPYVLLFRPDWASAYSLEPYTYVTDAFNLPYAYERTGARGIAPGEEIEFSTCMWVE